MSKEENLLESNLVEELQERLEKLEGDDIMDAGVVDGFLTAALLNPDHPTKAAVFPYIFSVDGDPAALPEDDRILELIGIRMNEISIALAARNGLDPVIFPLLDDKGEIILDKDGIEALAPWANGFLFGLQFWPDELQEDPEIEKLCIPILRNFSAEDIGDEEKYAEFISVYRAGKQPKNLEEALYEMVEAIFALKHRLDPNKPQKREEPKVGRNDPCPCGSGKKFKQCCAKKA